MSARGFRAMGTAIVLVAVGLGLWIAVPRLLGGALGSDDVRVLSALHDRVGDGMRLTLPGSDEVLVGGRVRLGPTTVHLVEGEGRAVAVAMLDFTGRLGETEVSSLGYERVPFVRNTSGRWEPETSAAPRLVAAVSALESRRRALEAADPASLAALAIAEAPAPLALEEVRGFFGLEDRHYEAKAWLLRSERDEVLVAEQYRLRGDSPARPVDRVGLRNLRLVPTDQGLLFSPGLM